MKLELKDVKISVIGLGYVGLPLAIQFNKFFKVIGFDKNLKRIKELRRSFDRTNEVSQNDISKAKNLTFESDLSAIKDSNVYIVTVPTPVDKNKNPNLEPLKEATLTISRYLNKNNIVIYESTVYPGCTEEICVPILEKKSNLIYNVDFFCGYSPERINPADKVNTLTNIVKITSGSNELAEKFVDILYKKIIKAGTFLASSIAVAEAAKVIENTQRDVNIALVNELAIIFNKLGLSTKEVLKAAGTKWNFLPFSPGLVGGHCIGVDPYYLTHKAIEIGYHPEIIIAGRRINDNVGKYIAKQTIEQLALKGVNIVGAKISIFGLTFKENCPDLRNTKVSSIIEELKSYRCDISITDPWVHQDEARELFSMDLKNIEKIEKQDLIILAVAHDEYKKFSYNDWGKMLSLKGTLIDIKSLYSKKDFKGTKINYWSL